MWYNSKICIPNVYIIRNADTHWPAANLTHSKIQFFCEAGSLQSSSPHVCSATQTITTFIGLKTKQSTLSTNVVGYGIQVYFWRQTFENMMCLHTCTAHTQYSCIDLHTLPLYYTERRARLLLNQQYWNETLKSSSFSFSRCNKHSTETGKAQ